LIECAEYLGNKQATAETIDKDGWLHTGDLVYFSTDGYLYIVDRLKELIKYKANQVCTQPPTTFVHKGNNAWVIPSIVLLAHIEYRFITVNNE
jgi:hypothetical protein